MRLHPSNPSDPTTPETPINFVVAPRRAAAGGPPPPVNETAACGGAAVTACDGGLDDCCADKGAELEALGRVAGVRRILQIVLVINLVMFVAEFAAGVVAQSTALMADSVDMLGDAAVYALSLYALDRSLRWRAGAALAKGVLIALFGAGILVEVAFKIVQGVTPAAPLMAAFGAVALAANLTCLLLLFRHRNRDVNLSSTFECSRNDVLANGGVLLAAGGVFALQTGWPDIVVGLMIAALFLRSAVKVLGNAWPQFRDARDPVAVS